MTLPQNSYWIGDCPSHSAGPAAAAAAAAAGSVYTPSQLKRSPFAWAWSQNLPAFGGNWKSLIFALDCNRSNQYLRDWKMKEKGGSGSSETRLDVTHGLDEGGGHIWLTY